MTFVAASGYLRGTQERPIVNCRDMLFSSHDMFRSIVEYM